MNKSSTFCPAPWKSILLSPNGKVYTCYEASDYLGDISEAPLGRLLESKKLKDIKTKMKLGQEVSQCEFCDLKDKAQEGESLRALFMKQYSGANTYDLMDPLSEVESVDISFSNQCNMQCLTCGPEYSSKWSSSNKITSYAGYVKKNIYPLIGQLKNITIAGGEPFLQKEVSSFLSELILLKRVDIKLELNSNGSIVPEHFLKLLSKFSNLQICLSIDGVGDDAVRIRPGVKWEKILTNIKLLKKRLPHATITSYTTVSTLNILNFPSMVNYFLDNKLFELKHIALHYLRTPERYSIRNIDKVEKKLIAKRNNFLIKNLIRKGLPLDHVMALSKRIRLINNFMTLK